jgi:hypothetical protein
MKNSMKSLTNRMEQAESRVSEIEDKVKKLEYSDKVKEKILRKYEWKMQDLWYIIKRPNLQIIGIEKEEV